MACAPCRRLRRCRVLCRGPGWDTTPPPAGCQASTEERHQQSRGTAQQARNRHACSHLQAKGMASCSGRSAAQAGGVGAEQAPEGGEVVQELEPVDAAGRDQPRIRGRHAQEDCRHLPRCSVLTRATPAMRDTCSESDFKTSRLWSSMHMTGQACMLQPGCAARPTMENDTVVMRLRPHHFQSTVSAAK